MRAAASFTVRLLSRDGLVHAAAISSFVPRSIRYGWCGRSFYEAAQTNVAPLKFEGSLQREHDEPITCLCCIGTTEATYGR